MQVLPKILILIKIHLHNTTKIKISQYQKFILKIKFFSTTIETLYLLNMLKIL